MAFTSAALVVAVAVALLVVYVSRMWFKQRKLNLPPGPTPLPILGSFHLLGTHPHRSLADLAQKYGPLMSIQLGQRFCIVATSAEAAKEFLKVQDANFSSRPPIRAGELLMPKDIGFHDLTPVTRHLRKVLVSELTSAKRLEASKYIRTEELAYMLQTVSRAKGPIQVKAYLHTMSTNIISRMILSKRFLGQEQRNQNGSEVQEFIEIVQEFSLCIAAIHLQDVVNFIPKWFDPQGLDARCRKLKARMDVFYTNVVNQHKEERRKNPVSKEAMTLLDVLLEQLQNPEYTVTEEHIFGVVWDAFIGGTDTTTTMSEWAMAEVLRNPRILKTVRSELDYLVGLNRTVQEFDIPQLKYMQAVVKETMRLHAIVPLLLPHHSIHATKAFGFDIPAKTRLFVNLWGLVRDPQVWENPLEFLPERFLEGAPHGNTEFQGRHFEFIPFGSGRRSCPGMAFGSIAVHLEVANLLHAFEWSFPDDMIPETLDMSERNGATLAMQNPLVASAKPRLASHLYRA